MVVHNLHYKVWHMMMNVFSKSTLIFIKILAIKYISPLLSISILFFFEITELLFWEFGLDELYI